MNETPDLIGRVSRLEESVENLKSKKKDRWDKFQILAALLIPASITVVGIAFTNAQKQAEVIQSEREAQLTELLGTQNLKAEQAKLVSSYLDALTSENATKRSIAIAALQYALGKESEPFLKAVAAIDPDPIVRREATRLLHDLGALGIRLRTSDSFSNSERERAIELITAASSNPALLENVDFQTYLEDVLDSFFAADLRKDVRKIERVVTKIDSPSPGISMTLIQFFAFEALRTPSDNEAIDRFNYYSSISPETTGVATKVFRAGIVARQGDLVPGSKEVKELISLSAEDYSTAVSYIESLSRWGGEESKIIATSFRKVQEILQQLKAPNNSIQPTPKNGATDG